MLIFPVHLRGTVDRRRGSGSRRRRARVVGTNVRKRGAVVDFVCDMVYFSCHPSPCGCVSSSDSPIQLHRSWLGTLPSSLRPWRRLFRDVRFPRSETAKTDLRPGHIPRRQVLAVGSVWAYLLSVAGISPPNCIRAREYFERQVISSLEGGECRISTLVGGDLGPRVDLRLKNVLNPIAKGEGLCIEEVA